MGKVIETNIHRKKPRKKWPYVTLGVLILLVILIFSGLFNVKEPEITGNERVTNEIVMENLDMKPGMNLLGYMLRHYNTDFELDPLILSAEVFIHWPNRVTVEVTEKKVMGYIPYMGMYLCIDTTGSVLDSIHEVPVGTPLLTGITVQSFSMGSPIDT